jgi:hypothetical protein
LAIDVIDLAERLRELVDECPDEQRDVLTSLRNGGIVIG